MSERAKRLALSWLRVFLGAAVASYITLGKTPFDLGTDDLKVMAAAGLAAAAVVVVNWLNPKDERYGIGSRPW